MIEKKTYMGQESQESLEESQGTQEAQESWDPCGWKKGKEAVPGRCALGTASFGGGGGDLLSRFRSIIGAPGFNFSVRNGKRWSPRAVAALMPFAVVSVYVAGAWRPPRARTSMTGPEEGVRSGRRVPRDTGHAAFACSPPRLYLCAELCSFLPGGCPGGKGSGY